MKRRCQVCNKEIETMYSNQKYCRKCAVEMHKSYTPEKPKQVTHVNQKIIDEVREATKLGLTYGKYKGKSK